jgi:hypothetical protein
VNRETIYVKIDENIKNLMILINKLKKGGLAEIPKEDKPFKRNCLGNPNFYVKSLMH